MTEDDKELMEMQQPELVKTPKARSKSRTALKLETPEITEDESDPEKDGIHDPYVRAANREMKEAKRIFEEA